MQAIIQLFQARKPYCQHEHGCIRSALAQAFKNVKYGIIISSILQIVRSIRALLKGKQAFMKSCNKRVISIIVFMVASTLTLRLVKCGLKWLRETDDGFNSLVAGMAAGYVGTKTLNQDYWYLLLMFLGSRLIAAIYEYLTQYKILNPQHKKWHHYLMFNFSHSVHAYGYFQQPDILKGDMYNLYKKMSVLDKNEQKWLLSALQYNQKALKSQKIQQLGGLFQQRIKRFSEKINSK